MHGIRWAQQHTENGVQGFFDNLFLNERIFLRSLEGNYGNRFYPEAQV
jgi:hypothetical protein